MTVFASSIAAKPKVAVLGLEVTGNSAADQKATEAAKVLTRELRREANKSGGPFDLAPNSGKDLLEMKLLSDCSDEGRRCMSDIGKQLRADRLIYGNLARTRRGYAIELRLLDTEKADLLEEIDEVIPGSEVSASGGLARRARALYGRLTGAGEEGSLTISASAGRGTVYVDGEIRTSLSAGSARVSGLSQGVHRVAIEARGFERFESDVNIKSGANRNLRANLIALEDAPPSEPVPGERDDGGRPGSGWRIAVWGGVLATAGAGAGWAYSGLTVRSEQDKKAEASLAYNGDPLPGLEGDRYPDVCSSFSMAGDDLEEADREAVAQVLSACDKGKQHEKLVNLVWIPATAAAVLFTGFAVYKGYIAPGKMSSREREAARRARAKARVTVTPAIGPNLVGAGLELQF